MFKYIGIRGHRGAGKNTIAYLLGTAIEFYLVHNNWEGFELVYQLAVQKVLEEGGETIPEYDFKNVYFESFADTAKITLAQILGFPTDWMYNDWCKDATIIDLKDFSFERAQNKLNLHSKLSLKQKEMYTAEQLYNAMQQEDITQTKDHVYITLRELIVYYSKYVVQKYFGKNVWVKSLENSKWENERFYALNKTIYKIFVDCKFPTEISYIYNNEGKIVKVTRDNNVKPDTNFSEQLANDNRFDYEIELDGDLLKPDTIKTIKDITLKIIS